MNPKKERTNNDLKNKLIITCYTETVVCYTVNLSVFILLQLYLKLLVFFIFLLNVFFIFCR